MTTTTTINQNQPSKVSAERLEYWLDGYDPDMSNELVSGFRTGFRVHFQGTPKQIVSKNLPTALSNPSIVATAIDNLLQQDKVAGPFDSIPLNNFISSPLGLVPKHTPGEWRLIHHLSHPKGQSVNDGIPEYYSKVSYDNLDYALAIIAKLGKGTFISKSDVKSAFYNLPIHPQDYNLLGFTWEDQFYYFKVAAMGCSSSCRSFELLSTSLQWILQQYFQVNYVSHILDDFMFFHKDKDQCLLSLASFHALSKDINLPINHQKTIYPTTLTVLHGIEVDTIKMEARLPKEKIIKACELLEPLTRRRTVTLHELQQVIGTLNFACRVVAPGRCFLRRIIDLTIGLKRPTHHRNITKEARKDISAWLFFLNQYNGVSIIPQPTWTDSRILRLFTDSSNLGYAAVLQSQWFQGKWPQDWTVTHGGKNIALLELVPIVLAIQHWAKSLSGQRILLMCDNEALVYIINKQSSKLSEIMNLVRQLVVACMLHNIIIRAKHIPGVDNIIADRLSRFQNSAAFLAAPLLQREPTVLSPTLMPWNKLPGNY